jgi:hypothetical protein
MGAKAQSDTKSLKEARAELVLTVGPFLFPASEPFLGAVFADFKSWGLGNIGVNVALNFLPFPLQTRTAV